MDASKLIVDFFSGLSPEVKLDFFNASIELLRQSQTTATEPTQTVGFVGTPKASEREFVLNTPEKIKEQLDQHPIMGEAEMHRRVATQLEIPETVTYEPEPLQGADFWIVSKDYYLSDYKVVLEDERSKQYNAGLIYNNVIGSRLCCKRREEYLKSETFVRRYLRRRGQGKYMPVGSNFTIAYNHNSRRYGVFPASSTSQNTLPWLYAQNRDILQYLINNHSHHLDTIFEVTSDNYDNSSLP